MRSQADAKRTEGPPAGECRRRSGRAAHLFAHIAVAALVVYLGAPSIALDKVVSFGFTPEYLRIAEGIVETGRYVARLSEGVYLDAVYREPLFPYVAAWCTRHGQPWQVLLLMQKACLALSLGLWGYLGARRLGISAAVCMYACVLMSTVPLFYAGLLYPYAFQFLLITGASLLLLRAVERNSWLAGALAGLLAGAACYERAAYSLLPPFLAAMLWLFRRSPRTPLIPLLAWMIVSFLVIQPWVSRNRQAGVSGMHQRMGYQLGFTYGHLPAAGASGDQAEFTAALQRHRDELGTFDANDVGTFDFLLQKVFHGGLTYAEADQLVSALMLERIKQHPGAVMKNVANNLLYFPSRLGNVELARFLPHSYGRSAMQYYDKFAIRHVPTLADFALLGLALFGAWRLRRQETALVLIGLGLAFYTLGVVAPIGLMEPRYRGAADAILYLLAGHGILGACGSRSSVPPGARAGS